MKKQIIALVLCVLMVLVVFTACNGNKTTSSAAASSATVSKAASTAATSSVAQDAIRDVIVYRYGGTKSQQDVGTVNKAINEYINEKYKLNATQVYIDDYAATLQLKLTAKEAIDIYWCNGVMTNSLVGSKALYDISGKLDAHKDLYNAMPEKVWNGHRLQQRRNLSCSLLQRVCRRFRLDRCDRAGGGNELEAAGEGKL